MKNYTFIILFSMFNIVTVQAQIFSINDISSQPCKFDTTHSLMQLNDWEIYQTMNDLWNGERIENCYELSKQNYSFYLELENIYTDKPIFIQSKKALENDFNLNNNLIYPIYSSGAYHLIPSFNLERNCSINICSGIIISIEIPTEDGQNKTKRIHKLQFDNNFQLNGCLATEYFDSQKIKEVIIKLSLDSSAMSKNKIELPIRFVDIGQDSEIKTVTFDSLLVPSNILPNPDYNLNIGTAASSDIWDDWYLGLHDPNVYPKAGNNTYIEVQLEKNIINQSHININIDGYQTFSVQAHTELIGGLVLGSDSLRHQVSLIQNGSNMCLTIVELTFGRGTSLRYKSGEIHLASQNACIKFKKGAKLFVDHADMDYGDENGAGMMALLAGSEVHMLGKSRLTFNNTLAIISSNSTYTEYIDIYLERGQSLVFAKNSHIMSIGNPLIRLHMLGGSADISELSIEEQSKFIFVHPEPSPNLFDNLMLFPNPVNDQLFYTINSKDEQSVNWTLSDISGRNIAKGKDELRTGINENSIPFSSLGSGIYFLNLNSKEGVISKKIVRL